MAHTLTITKSKEGVRYSRSLDYILTILKDGVYTLTIERKAKKRSLSQNSLMWMWFNCLADETGQSVDDIHDTYCAMFLTRTAVNTHGDEVKVQRGTSKLNTSEMTDFMNRVQLDAAEMGIRLPRPEDEYYQEFENEYRNRIQL